MLGKLQLVNLVNFWEFCLDPKQGRGCGRMVENAFQCSFLVKDGEAKLDFKAEPYTITLRERMGVRGLQQEGVEEARARDMETAVNSQYIFELGCEKWGEMAQKYQTTECLLPSQVDLSQKRSRCDANLDGEDDDGTDDDDDA